MTIPSPSMPPATRIPGLADRAAHAFAPQACILGYTIFRKERLEVEDLGAARARLAGKGAKARRVEVRAAGEALEASCSCAPEALPMAPCRHLWAALLELDRREAFPAVRGCRGKLVVAMMAADLPPVTAEVSAERRRASATTEPKKAPVPKKAKPRSKPSSEKRAARAR